MKTLAILTNGGDTCALNASIKSVRDNAYRVGYKKIYGIRRGYQGLLDGWLEDITHKEIDVRMGGSFLGSMRESPARRVAEEDRPGEFTYKVDPAKCKIMSECLSDFGIDVLVVIGGDGTLQSTQLFQNWVHSKSGSSRPFQLLGFLKTIDNDIRTFTHFQGIEVALCPGFPSAVTKIISSVESLRVTARTSERAFAVETMGRDAGWLAASATFGGAELLLVPEVIEQYVEELSKTPSNQLLPRKEQKKVAERLLWQNVARHTASLYRRNRNVILAVAEGFDPELKNPDFVNFAEIIRNLYGDRKRVGATELFTHTLMPVLQQFFACLSVFARGEVDTRDLCEAIQYVLALEGPESSNYQQKVRDADLHALKDLSIKEMLCETMCGRYLECPEYSDREASPLMSNGRDAGAPLDDVAVDTTKDESEPKASEYMNTKLTLRPPYNFEIRPHRTDYVPRSGKPSSYDYRLASVLGQEIAEMLEKGEFGSVPCMAEVVPYDELLPNRVKTVNISDIRTRNFDSPDYFDSGMDYLTVSHWINGFFKTITTGPESLEEAIEKLDLVG